MPRVKEPVIVQVDAAVLDQVIEDAKRSLSEEQGKILEQLVEGYIHLTKAIQNKTLTLRELRALFANHTSEKAKDILPSEDASGGDDSENSDRNKGKGKGKDDKPKGHGRNGAKSYPGAETVSIPHESLHPGDPCPQCTKGTVYEKMPVVVLRIQGQA
ncbi:MAG: hypothetical protein GY725_22940, partial [bacterium]|nr:hypothetical protein [bacterium]